LEFSKTNNSKKQDAERANIADAKLVFPKKANT
jgi:hypothetical protein